MKFMFFNNISLLLYFIEKTLISYKPVVLLQSHLLLCVNDLTSMIL